MNNNVGLHGVDIANDNGSLLIVLCEQNNVKILNGFYDFMNIVMFINSPGHKRHGISNPSSITPLLDK